MKKLAVAIRRRTDGHVISFAGQKRDQSIEWLIKHLGSISFQ